VLSKKTKRERREREKRVRQEETDRVVGIEKERKVEREK
jgi:hypothetical protein